MAAAAADWSSLDHDVFYLIVGRLGSFDYLCCRAACRSWRSALHCCRSQPQPPFLPLSRGNFDDPLLLSFRDLRSYPLSIPELDDHQVVGFSQGWLFAFDPLVELRPRAINAFVKFQLHAINPLTRTRQTLPPTATFTWSRLPFDEEPYYPPVHLCCLSSQLSFFYKVILRPSPVPSPTSFTAVAIFGPHKELVFARAGDTSWTHIKPPISAPTSFADVMFRDGRLHALTTDGELALIDLDDSATSFKLVSIRPSERRWYCQERRYLVESGGRLLQVMKGARAALRPLPTDSDPPKLTVETVFEVFRLHESRPKWVSRRRLGPYALFLGFNNSMLLPVREFPQLRRDCIYFTDYRHVPNRKVGIAIFCLKDGSIESFSPPD